MATMLLSLGKKVTMVTDKRGLEMNQAIIDEAVRTGETELKFKSGKSAVKNNMSLHPGAVNITERISLSCFTALHSTLVSVTFTENDNICNSILRCAEN